MTVADKSVLDYVQVCQEEQQCCSNFVDDEGRPLDIGVRALVSNRPLLLSLRAMVVSELGKGRSRIGQVGP